MLAEKKQKGKKRKEKAMRKRIFAAFVCLCMLMALVPSMAYAGDTVSVGGLCEHHTQHDDACGYSEATTETPCTHEHTEDCYTLVTKCVHEHMAECYSDGILPADGEEKTADSCSHQCSEESGCITKELNCNHEHDGSCGYVPAKEETPCNFVCEICNAPAAEEAECICETKCTEEEPNADCPVCGGENGDISGCVGAAMMLAPMGAGAITATPPAGDGTKEKPYQITNAAELYWFAGLVNGDESIIGNSIKQNTGACAVLTENITINENVLDENGSLNGDGSGLEQWTPIGSEVSNKYTGTFDGDGHTISGLYVNIIDSDDPREEAYAGLFGCVGSGGNIQNVGVEDSYIRVFPQNTAYDYAGGVCGSNEGTITKCYNTGTVSSSDSVGGVCGGNAGTITNCYNTGTVSGGTVGGVSGQNYGTIENSYNTGTVSDGSAGGVCGQNYNGTITNCYNTGEVSGTYAGGVCGWNKLNSTTENTIINCYNIGKVSGDYVGGVCGLNEGTIIGCNNRGEVSGTSVGGVCGLNKGTIKNSYNIDTVNGSGSNAGGVCGSNEGTITNCYNTGTVSGQNIVGGVCGQNYDTIENSYNTGTVSAPTNVNSMCAKNYKTITNCYFYRRNVDGGWATKKTDSQFKSGEVAWLLNGSQNPKPWGQGSNGIPVLVDNLPKDVTCTDPVRVTIQMPDGTSEQYGYTTKGNTLAEYPSQLNGKTYTFYEDSNFATPIDTATKTYEKDTVIYAKEKKNSSGGGSVFFWDLKFDTNGGSDIDTVTEWEYSTIDLDEYVPEKEGYKFVGWYADKDLDKKIDEVYLTEDTTVYAKWEKIEEEVPEEPEEVEETEETETISFKDVKENDWFYEAVSYAVENGLMSGMSEDIFAPNTPLTREMLAVVLYNVEGQPESAGVNPFTDVKADIWYTDAILWANENGIVAGYDNGAYGVGDFITREQFAAILYRYAQFKGYDTTQGGMAVREFSDYENISDYARPAMAWAVNAGIMGGMDDGTLMPQGKATRAEAATMLMNFCENMVEK